MAENIKKQIEAIIQTHKDMLAEFETVGIDPVIDAAKAITKSIKDGGCIYICGNGGSAADAQHITGELVGRFLRERKALPAVALTTDTSVMTSVANDYDYKNIFVRQAEALVKKGDLLWAISTSGSSPNIVAAAELAKKKGAVVLAFTGKNNSKLEQLSDICFCAENEIPARTQEIHQIAYHIICDLVEQDFTND